VISLGDRCGCAVLTGIVYSTDEYDEYDEDDEIGCEYFETQVVAVEKFDDEDEEGGMVDSSRANMSSRS